jgi:hypothetical protein
MRTVSIAVAASALMAFAPVAFAGDIVRCVARDGAVTYQQVSCPESSREKVAGIASEYPPPNLNERERLLAKEQEMYRRLEAQRDRDTQIEMARQARAAVEARAQAEAAAAAAAATAEPYYVGWPARPARPVHHHAGQRGNQPVWSGGNPLSPGFSR